MASGIFLLLDDIVMLMDDVAVLSKVTTKKTAGILADDLAVNAEKSSGFVASRELPVIWKITKGSFKNKLIILPVAFLLSAFLPDLIIIILLLGGVFLGYEGVEKIYEFIFHKKQEKKSVQLQELTKTEILDKENKKIKSAILVDFILSIEIIIISIGTVIEQPIHIQITVVTIVSIFATIGVYGLVALLVRMDDFGFKLISISNRSIIKSIGTLLVKSLPIVIRILAVVGTFAMLLVSGGIFMHNVHTIHQFFNSLPALLSELIIGLFVGTIALLAVKLIMIIKGSKTKNA